VFNTAAASTAQGSQQKTRKADMTDEYMETTGSIAAATAKGLAQAEDLHTCGTSSAAGVVLCTLPPNHPSVTVILFSVSVPVLSLQMAVAPPMVSQAASTLRTSSSSSSSRRVAVSNVHNYQSVPASTTTLLPQQPIDEEAGRACSYLTHVVNDACKLQQRQRADTAAAMPAGTCSNCTTVAA
jgi:hypothetical protein